MIAILLLIAPASPPPPPAALVAQGVATIVRGERIRLDRPAPGPDPQQREIYLKDERRTLRLIEFQ